MRAIRLFASPAMAIKVKKKHTHWNIGVALKRQGTRHTHIQHKE